MKNTVISIVGARPQFIKAAVVSRKFSALKVNHLLVHTGQHYDFNMSEIFFQELDITDPDFHLGVGSGEHGEQTGRMLAEIEKVLRAEQPSLVIVYGDTNTTLAGALASVKLKIPVAHVEAGLRSYKKYMPEEINRVVTDHVSELLFAPTDTAVKNLEKESIIENVYNTGDVMFDIAQQIEKKVRPREQSILLKFKLEHKNYVLATIHREDNTNIEMNLRSIIEALQQVAQDGRKIFFPAHPRTKKYIQKYGYSQPVFNDNFILSDPVSYSEMIILEKNARVILTDSGGVQKEAYFFKTPAVIPRDETEWVEIVTAGWNIVTGADTQKIREGIERLWRESHMMNWQSFYGDGDASGKIGRIVKGYITSD